MRRRRATCACSLHSQHGRHSLGSAILYSLSFCNEQLPVPCTLDNRKRVLWMFNSSILHALFNWALDTHHSVDWPGSQMRGSGGGSGAEWVFFPSRLHCVRFSHTMTVVLCQFAVVGRPVRAAFEKDPSSASGAHVAQRPPNCNNCTLHCWQDRGWSEISTACFA